MVNRKNDIQDILDKVTTGWITPPAQPPFVIEDRDNTRHAWIHDNKRCIMILKDRRNESEMIYHNAHESRLWVFKILIIGSSEDDAEQIYEQMKEVLDRYTNVPWSTSTLGTSTTYSTARVFGFTQDHRKPRFVFDCEIELLEEMVAVVIA